MPIRCQVLKITGIENSFFTTTGSRPYAQATLRHRYPHREYELERVPGGQVAGRTATAHPEDRTRQVWFRDHPILQYGARLQACPR